jgi:hypothetical protein
LAVAQFFSVFFGLYTHIRILNGWVYSRRLAGYLCFGARQKPGKIKRTMRKKPDPIATFIYVVAFVAVALVGALVYFIRQ